MGRLFNKALVPYADAVMMVRRAGISNIPQYKKWYDKEQPLYLPKHPNAHYGRLGQWESWNHFLGTTNSFEKTLARKKGEKITYRPFWEAVRYAQQMAKEFNLTTQKEWEGFCEEYDVPRDIPKRPHHKYSEFVGSGWKVWLGTNAVSKVASQKKNVAVFALHHASGKPANVIISKVHKDGYHAMVKTMGDDSGMGKAYRVYFYEDGDDLIIDSVMSGMCSKQGDGSYIVPDVNALLWELDNALLIYRE